MVEPVAGVPDRPGDGSNERDYSDGPPNREHRADGPDIAALARPGGRRLARRRHRKVLSPRDRHPSGASGVGDSLVYGAGDRNKNKKNIPKPPTRSGCAQSEGDVHEPEEERRRVAIAEAGPALVRD